MRIWFKFLAFLANFFNVIVTLELCRSYEFGELEVSSFFCVDFCCGNCNFRYCCSNETLTLDQSKCHNNQINKSEFSTQSQIQLSSTKKPSATMPIVFPATTTTTPLIFAKPPKKTKKPTNDSKEKHGSKEEFEDEKLTEVCDSFQDLYGYPIQPRRCPLFAKFCCGRCANRYCCDMPKERLNQRECKMGAVNNGGALSSTKTNSSSNSYSYVYVILILGLVIILAFTCVPFFIYINKSRSRNASRNNLTAIQNLTPLSVIGPPTQSNTSINSLPKVTYSSNSHDDMPPHYSTLKFTQNQQQEQQRSSSPPLARHQPPEFQNQPQS